MQPVVRTDVVEEGGALLYRPLLIAPMHVSKEPLPPRHRRKRKEEDSNNANNVHSSQTQPREHPAPRGAQFDLEDSAFPPLPGKLLLCDFVSDCN